MVRETAAEREKRLAEALRRNLARRKQQARGKLPEKSRQTDNSNKKKG